jgi:uncharacterized membrane protein
MVTNKISTGNYGGKAPVSIVNLYYSNGKFDPLSVDLTRIKAVKDTAGSSSINSNDKAEISYSGSALYSPLSYIPHSLSIVFAKLINLSVLQTIYLVRIIVFIVYLILVSLAIKISPIKKWFLFAVGTMPMSIMLAGNVTLDGLVISSAILIAAILMRLIVDKKSTFTLFKKTFSLLPLLCVMSIYFALTKPVYSPLLILNIFAINNIYNFKSLKWFKWMSLTLLLPLALMFAWNIGISALNIDSGQRLSVNSVGIYPPTKEQAIDDLLAHPLRPVKITIHTLVDSHKEKQDIPNYILGSFSGKFTEYRVSPANWLSVSVVLSLVLAFSLEEKKKYGFSKYMRISALSALVIGIIGTMTSMYLYATTRGALVINGIQGRYFIPFIPFLVFMVSSNRLVRLSENNKAKLMIIVFSMIDLGIMAWLLYATFS